MSTDLGYAELLGADATGQPGQRRFRLFVRTVSGSAMMWMEKEQLSSLSLAIDRFLAQLTQGQILRTMAEAAGQPVRTGLPAEFPAKPTYDIQIAHMQLQYEEDGAVFFLNALPGEIVREFGQEAQVIIYEDEAIAFRFTLEQAQALSSSINAIVTAGRPVCPFCSTPLDGGPHACVKQNGHREILLLEEGED